MRQTTAIRRGRTQLGAGMHIFIVYLVPHATKPGEILATVPAQLKGMLSIAGGCLWLVHLCGKKHRGP